MKYLLIILSLLMGLPAAAQVQWASEILSSSSSFYDRKFPGQYQARQALGPPSVLPGFGGTPCAWMPSRDNSGEGEFITVAFAEPQHVRALYVNEIYGAGAIDLVIFKDTDGKTHNVYSNSYPRAVEGGARLWRLPVERTSYKVEALRLRLSTKDVQGFNMIDAIGISDSEDIYAPSIRLSKDIALSAPPKNLGPAVNAAGEELCPVISPDGRSLYFTRQNHPENIDNAESQDIWMAAIGEDGEPSKAVNLGPPLNNAYNSSLTSITPDGQTALLLNTYLPDGTMDNGISLTRRTKDGWGQPEKVEMENYYNDNPYGEFCLSSSGKVMLLAIQRNDSEGSKDLYISFRKANGTWQEPTPLSSNVNTADSETSPYLAADDRTLYFSTAGHPGYGSKDMFVTRRIGDSWTEWSDPENLGPQLNTPGWDAYYSIPANGKYVYFVSYQEGGYGVADIYRAPLPQALRPKPVVLLRGTVTDKKTGEPLAADIRYSSLTTGLEIGIAHSDPVTGDYSIVLPAGDLFGFSGSKDAYLPISSSLDLKELAVYEELRKDLEMTPIEAGASIILNNIYFDTGKYELRRESDIELDNLAAVLKFYPNMQVEISGHTDNVGAVEDNAVLSQRRADAVRAYLVGKGIPSKQLIAIGKGESKPVYPNDSEENRQVNRRVEFTILKI